MGEPSVSSCVAGALCLDVAFEVKVTLCYMLREE